MLEDTGSEFAKVIAWLRAHYLARDPRTLAQIPAKLNELGFLYQALEARSLGQAQLIEQLRAPIATQSAGQPPQPAPSAAASKMKAERLVDESGLIFKGTIEQVGAATMADLPVTGRTAVVRMDEVLDRPYEIGDVTGDRITVELATDEDAKVGRHGVFFTTIGVIGDSLAVRQIGPLSADTPALRDLIGRNPDVTRRRHDRHLKHCVAEAEIVVSGQVVGVRPPVRKPGQPLSFNDPAWATATIQVDRVEKGQVQLREITLPFPTGGPRNLSRAPRFHVGQRGIWMLHRTPAEMASQGMPYASLHTTDYQGPDQLGTVRALIQNPGMVA